MNVRRILASVIWIAYGIFWIGGVGGHLLFGGTPANMGWTAPLFLFLASLATVIAAPEEWRALLVSFVIGLIAETIGVATGYPFGRYSYTHALAPSIAGVPIAVAGAWMILIAWVRQLRLPVWVGALAMTAFDLVIDPLAANTLGYWKWTKPGPYYGVPLLNFAGWAIVSAIILAVLRRPPVRNAGVVAIGCSILLFFALIGLPHALRLPSSLGFLLTGAGYLRWRSSMVSTRI